MNPFVRIRLSQPSMEKLKRIVDEANHGFVEGRVCPSDVIEMALLDGSFDIERLRVRNVDLRRVLKRMASSPSEIDVNAVVEELQRLKGVVSPKRQYKKASDV